MKAVSAGGDAEEDAASMKAVPAGEVDEPHYAEEEEGVAPLGVEVGPWLQ